jgi:DNA-damage-inducible protein D
METTLTPFEGKDIRRIEHNGEMWFAIVDIIEVLTESTQPKTYWSNLKRREPQLVSIRNLLKVPAADGKKYATDCANTEGVLRLIQSVASPKAEPFKTWLAALGSREFTEMSDPELGFERLKELYKAKGYDEKWIENRLKSIGIRKELTDEWQKRNITDSQDYARLTATIAKETFGLSPSEHSKLKGLNKENLRDHMTNLELLFSAIGEEAARLYTVEYDAQGFTENHDTAQRGGKAAGKAREAFEKERQTKVVSDENFLNLLKPTEPSVLPPKEE